MSDPAAAATQPAGERSWLTARERGTVFGIKALFTLATLAGRRATAPIVAMVALWYALFDRRARAASRAWLERVRGRPARFRDVYRHLRNFAQVTLDKVFLLTDRTRGMTFTRTGQELLAPLLASERGAMLLGAHLGSHEALSHGSESEGMSVEVLGYVANARMINALMGQLNPRHQARVIDIAGNPIDVMARVQDALEHRRMVVAMADRTGLDSRVVKAQFFGSEAPFAGGPLLMAAVLRCPVYLVFALYTAPNRYDLYMEKFADRIELPRKDRDGALRQWVQRYAERVEHFARLAPDNWFNFYDFWAPPVATHKKHRGAEPSPTP